MVGVIKAEGIDTEAVESLSRRLTSHDAVALDLGVVADAAKQAVGDTGRAARSACNFIETLIRRVDVQHTGGASQYPVDLFRRVEVHAVGCAKAIA